MLDNRLRILLEKDLETCIEMSFVLQFVENFVADQFHEIGVEFVVHRHEEAIKLAQLQEKIVLSSMEVKDQRNAVDQHFAWSCCRLNLSDLLLEFSC